MKKIKKSEIVDLSVRQMVNKVILDSDLVVSEIGKPEFHEIGLPLIGTPSIGSPSASLRKISFSENEKF